MEAWATLGGAIAATAAAVFTGWLLYHELQQARAAREEAALAAAQTVVFTRVGGSEGSEPSVEHETYIPGEDARPDHLEGQVTRVGGEVGNYGTSPVTDVDVYITPARGVAPLQRLATISVLPAGETRPFGARLTITFRKPAVDDEPLDFMVVGFTDVRGNRCGLAGATTSRAGLDPGWSSRSKWTWMRQR
jgi:hypothetical protein